MKFPALLLNRMVAEHLQVVLYQTTLVPPSAETTATCIIYTLNRMLNFGCVPNSADQWWNNGHQNWLISQVQEHEIDKDSKDGLHRSACSTFLTWWSNREKAKLLKRICIVKVHPDISTAAETEFHLFMAMTLSERVDIQKRNWTMLPASKEASSFGTKQTIFQWNTHK